MPEAHCPAEDVRATTAVAPFQGSRYNKTSSQPLLELYDPSRLAALVREFTLRYANASTAR